MDYSDLMKATNDFRESCKELNNNLQKELEAKKAYLEAESEARKKYWKQWQIGNITGKMYEESIKNEVFELKVVYEASKTERAIASNRKESLYEKLNTTKKTYSII